MPSCHTDALESIHQGNGIVKVGRPIGSAVLWHWHDVTQVELFASAYLADTVLRKP